MTDAHGKSIVLYCNYVTGGWSPVNRALLNGSEEAVVQVAEIWAKQGHDVQVYQNGFLGECNGVFYRARKDPLPEKPDLLITFKTLEHIEHPAAVRIFWTIDLPGPNPAVYFPPRLSQKIDVIVCVSGWHRDQVLNACPWISPDKVKTFWLGVDFNEIITGPKVPGRCIYASSLDRGLHPLLDMWPEIKKRAPAAELHVLYGWDFWLRSESVVPEEVRQSMIKERKDLEQLLKQPGVTYIGRPETREAYCRELGEAEVWLYPCTGGELCCKVALEVQASGVIPVAWPTMALTETVLSPMFHSPSGDGGAFITQTLKTLKHREFFVEELQKVREKIPSWEQLANQLWAWADQKLSFVPPVEPELFPEVKQFEIPRRKQMAPHKLDIMMAVPGMPFVGDTDQKESLGGSETMGLQVARELAKRDHRVTMFCNLPQGAQSGKYDNVTYLPISELGGYLGSYAVDAYIAQRDPTLINIGNRARVTTLWCHDLGLFRSHTPFRGSLWNLDYVVPVSHWHGVQLRNIYGIGDSSTIVPMRNGIDANMVTKAAGWAGKRDKNAVVYAARPERGLALLLDRIFPRLLEKNPKLTLYIAGYNNTVEAMKPLYDYCQDRVKQYGSRVRWMGHLKKPELYGLYARAWAYLYPTNSFEEVSCVSAMECAACGLPFVASARGALPETVDLCPGFARLVPHPGEATEAYIEDYVEQAWQVLSSEEVNTQMSQAGRQGASVYSIAQVGADWEEFLQGAIEERTKNCSRIFVTKFSTGDTYGAKKLMEEYALETPAPQLAELKGRAEILMPDEPGEPPVNLLPYLTQCIQGFSFQSIRGIGVVGERVARELAQTSGKPYVEGLADLLISFETLDCAPNPEAHILELESQVLPGGHVITAVAGPGVAQSRIFESGLRHSTKGRWIFDGHDIRDLIGQKKDFMQFVFSGNLLSKYDTSPMSWLILRWQVGGKLPKMDWQRRRDLAVPEHQTVSVCMIVKNAESLLLRCLKSIERHADEILIGNDSSTDSTLEIAARFGAKVFPIPSPLDIGFDGARNLTIEKAKGDWICWIDADEELLEGDKLPKYFRQNGYLGYGVRQHHFSAVPEQAFKPDLPVRFFRRLQKDKPTDIRFFGFVHEHPELRINTSVGEQVVMSDVHLAHDGYLTEGMRRGRFDRNLKLMFRDQQLYPDRKLGKFLMLRDWIHLSRNVMAQNNGGVTPDVVQYLEAALVLFQEEFLGATHIMGIDGLGYYNEALNILGRGYDVQIALKIAGINGQSQDLNYVGRMASVEDLQKLLRVGIETMTSPWTGKYI